MDELLNILRVDLCNCSLSNKNVQDIKDYIENRSTIINLEGFKIQNLVAGLRKNHNISKDLFRLLDEEKKDEAKFKRILNAFFAVGGTSLFQLINEEFYKAYEVIEYLKAMDDREMLLTWVLDSSITDCETIINILEDLLHLDEKMLSKAFSISEKDYQKFVIIIFMSKYNYSLPDAAEEMLQNYLKDNIEKSFAYGRLDSIIQFLYYAHESRPELKDIITKTVNNSNDSINIFDRLVRFVEKNDPNVDIYEFVQRFNINKTLYITRLINQYLKNEDKKLLQELNDLYKKIPLVFRECLESSQEKNSDNFEKFIISFIIFENSKDFLDLEYMYKIIRNILNQIFLRNEGVNKLSALEKNNLLLYILEGTSRPFADEWLSKLENRIYPYCGGGTIVLKMMFCLEETKSIIYRLMEISLIAEKYDTTANIVNDILQIPQVNFISFADKFIKDGVDEVHFIFTADKILKKYNSENDSKIMDYLKKLSEEDNENLKNNLVDLNANIKEFVLEELFHSNKEKNISFLVKFLADPSKGVREKVISLLSTYEFCKEDLLKQLKSKKTATRESVARILFNFDMKDYKDVLKEAVEAEKNEKIKSLLLNIINRDYMDEKSLESAESISEYCKDILDKLSYTVPDWLSFNYSQGVRYKDGNIISREVIEYISNKYSFENIVERNSIAEKIILNCNRHDLDVLGDEILTLWINNGANTQEKWVLAMVSAFGGFNVIATLKKQIEDWSKGTRGAIACEAVKSLALNGSNEALIAIDSLSRKIKHKQIKKAAEEAFVFAATLLNLSDEELADRIVPDLEFSKIGERVFDYGNRSFVVTLELDCSLKIQDDSGKFIKTLPKPNKSDDEFKAKEATEEFKVLKKQIKDIVSTQSLRLEMALVGNRLWKKVDWEKLFVENPIMHNFSLGLVWGVYDNEKFLDTFRYMEDGSFNTVDEEEYELEENSLIGLVHPLEMVAEDLKTWRQQFEDYEILQPFPQISRKVYIISDEEKKMKWIERFGGTKIKGLSLIGNFSKFGWYRGSVLDGAGYYEFYKEDAKTGIGAEISFEGLSIGLEAEETIIHLLKFYKAKTVNRNNYSYDNISDDNIIIPLNVPKRFLSEILYEVDRTLEAKTGTVANWKRSIT